MNKKLYYTVERETQPNDFDSNVVELTGMKTIQVYDIIDNQPKMFCTIDARLEDSSENEIQTYLDNNDYGDEMFDFVEL